MENVTLNFEQIDIDYQYNIRCVLRMKLVGFFILLLGSAFNNSQWCAGIPLENFQTVASISTVQDT